MTLRRHFACLFVSLSVGMGCSGSTGPSSAVSLILSVEPTENGNVLAYQFTVANGSSAAIFLPACNHTVRPDFLIGGPANTRDHYSGSVCITIYSQVPVRLDAGASYTGEGVLGRRDGVWYTPSIRYSFKRDFSRPRTAEATRFSAP